MKKQEVCELNRKLLTTRRRFLAVPAATASVLSLASFLPRLGHAQSTVLKRRNIDDLSAVELGDYEAAVDELKKRSTTNPNDPKGYDYLAKLHNVSRMHPDGTQGACEHFSEEFFPWHRAHLAIFERLLREIDPNITIPYWDWTLTPSGNRLPTAFERMASPLYHTGRFPNPAPPVIWDADEVKEYVQEADWTLFAGEPKSTSGSYGNVEDEPHNALHPLIGPTMGNQFTAAEDPVYWSFHAYIDLIWSRWQNQHSIAYECPACTLWLEPDQFTVEQMTDTTEYGYEYDYDYSIDEPAPVVAILFPAGGVAMKIDGAGTRALTATPEPGAISAAESGATMTRKLLELRGVQTYQDLTYRLHVYVHPKDVAIEPLSEADRQQYLVKTKTVWRSHHGIRSTAESQDMHEGHGRPSIYVDVSKALNAYSGDDWTVTVIADSAPNVLAGTEAYKSQKEVEDSRIEDLQGVIETIEIVDR